ncbi:transposase [Mycobacterium sp. 050134]|uniref:transposase n=1 Tax=Mycobacterium sp. 050134 TaxID=3096111 RepID=UPI003FA53708
MIAAVVLAVGDGALGFWKAVGEVFRATREQRRWFHSRPMSLPHLKSADPSALAAIKDTYNAEGIDRAQVAVKAFEVDFGAKHPKAVAKIVDDLETLLEFYNYPAKHWIHLRPQTRSNRPSPRCDCGPESPRVRDHGQPVLPWRQADRRRTSTLASRERPTPGRPGPRWRGLVQRQTTRTTHRHNPTRTRRINRNGGCLTKRRRCR